VGTTEEPTQWDQVREEVERDILTALFNRSGLWGEYLSSIAFMPKGVTASILRVAWGMRVKDAEELLEELEPLSFVKRYKPLRTSDLSQHAQYFLHDEMYRLMTRPGVIPNLRFKERKVAHSLIENYYSAQIDELKTQIADIPLSEERVRLREQLQRLQIDRLYYLFVRDPLEGYEEYKRLSSSANRHRWIGFSMSLLDEFLRFYYADKSSGSNQQLTSRREAFEKAGLSHEQVVRESAWMWIERFDWWGQDERLITFAEWVFEHPDDLFIQPDKDLAIWGNITAFWTGARARQHGYESEAVERADSVLGSLPRLSQCTTEEAFARARLCTAIGFQYRLAGMIDRAIEYYQKARAAFMELGQPTLRHEEHALLLSSMAFAFAEQGNMRLARPLAHEALRINEEMGNDYSRGLTLATLSQIARMRENYGKAREYAQESNEVFQELGDVRGVALAVLRMAQAKRRWAKHELEKERSRDEAEQQLTQALRGIKESLKNVKEAGIASLIPELILEQGLVHREMGRMIHEYEGLQAAIPEYSKALESLRRAHNVSSQHGTQQHDVLQDMAEVTFHMGDLEDAHAILDQIQEEVGQGYYFESWQNASPDHLPPEPFRTLGKVELLRGQIAFREGQSSEKESRKKCEEGLKHYALAYAYFTRFSPDAVHKETMLEYVFNHLRDITVEDRRAAFSAVSKWLGEQQLGIDTTSFVNDIAYLFGV
jgi:tetratricopeptide (TPR) repeat protein